jgi:hypothetical protein
MTCDELQLTFPEGAADMVAQAHLEACGDCRASLEALTLAAQPMPPAAERAKLAGLAGATHAAWLAAQKRRSARKNLVSLALAASVGALIATGVMWKLAPRAPVVVPAAEPSMVVWMEDATPLAADDASNFEVSWPSLEGDVL